MRFLITGGSGFIGSHVTRRLAGRGEATVVVSRGRPLGRLASCSSHLRIIEADLRDAEAVRRVVTEVRPTAVVHLAAAGVTPGGTAAEIIATNVLGTYHLLAALRDAPTVRSVVVAGSWYEYGPALTTDPQRVPAPTTPYGISKLASTHFVEMFAARSDIPAVVLRPFQVYGPDEPTHRLIPLVLRGALSGQGIILRNPGSYRDWVYVDDVARACEAAIDREVSGGPAIDIGTGIAISVGDVATRALRLAGLRTDEPPREENPLTPDDSCLSGSADIRAAAERLGWKADTDLDSGLRLTVEQYLQKHGNHASS